MARSGALREAMRIDSTTTPADDAGRVYEAMADESAEGVVLSFPDGRTVSLPASLVELVRSTAGELASGRAVTVTTETDGARGRST